jgi:predicted small lipoprotein YifL
MKKFIGIYLTGACLLALGGCAADGPKTTPTEKRTPPTAKVRDFGAQIDSNRAMDGPPR